MRKRGDPRPTTVVLGHGKIWLGVAPAESTGGWVVWLSIYGSDVNRLSGWETQEQAARARDRYVAAANRGYSALVAALRVDESTTAGHRPRSELSAEEVARIEMMLARELT